MLTEVMMSIVMALDGFNQEPQLIEDCAFIINGISSCIALDPQSVGHHAYPAQTTAASAISS